MAIIDSIRLSGVTYQLGGSGGSGATAIEVTQAQYDALVESGTVDTSAFYIITDAPSVDISNYYTSAQTNAAINAAVSGKQDTLIAGSGISIDSANTISVTGGSGGGKAIEAGRGISVTTGSTADTVSFNLPISAGTGANSVIIGGTSTNKGNNNLVVGSDNNISSGSRSLVVGYRCSRSGDGGATIGWNSTTSGDFSIALGQECTASANSSFARGRNNNASKNYSFASGLNIIANNESEHSSGQYNNSVLASTTFGNSGNTLFSVGNGTADNARHNALEIRQNGDIYCSNGTSDVKLQDYLQVKVVQISQSDYDQLQNKDANTLYLITNS